MGVNCDLLPWVCLAVTPMGWSWAPWVAQTVLEDVMDSSNIGLSAFNHLRDKSEIPTFLAFQFLHWIYIDDFLIMFLAMHSTAELERQAGRLAKILRPHLKKSGLGLHKEQVGWGVPLSIGMTVDADEPVLHTEDRKLMLLIRATQGAIARQFLTSLEMDILLGNWAWAILGARFGYSILNACYAYVQKMKGVDGPVLWPSARQELAVLAAIGPLLCTNLAAERCLKAMMVDATPIPFGIVYTMCTAEECRAEERTGPTMIWEESLAREQDPTRLQVEEKLRVVSGDVHRAERIKKGRGMLVAGGVAKSLVTLSRALALWWSASAEEETSTKGDITFPKTCARMVQRVERGLFFSGIFGPNLGRKTGGLTLATAAARIVSAMLEVNSAFLIFGKTCARWWNDEEMDQLRSHWGYSSVRVGLVCVSEGFEETYACSYEHHRVYSAWTSMHLSEWSRRSPTPSYDLRSFPDVGGKRQGGRRTGDSRQHHDIYAPLGISWTCLT